MEIDNILLNQLPNTEDQGRNVKIESSVQLALDSDQVISHRTGNIT